MTDPQRFRVNLICKCKNDLVYGYGASIDEARTNAQRFFRKDHKRQTPAEEIIEEVTPDGSHYEEIQ